MSFFLFVSCIVLLPILWNGFGYFMNQNVHVECEHMTQMEIHFMPLYHCTRSACAAPTPLCRNQLLPIMASAQTGGTTQTDESTEEICKMPGEKSADISTTTATRSAYSFIRTETYCNLNNSFVSTTFLFWHIYTLASSRRRARCMQPNIIRRSFCIALLLPPSTCPLFMRYKSPSYRNLGACIALSWACVFLCSFHFRSFSVFRSIFKFGFRCLFPFALATVFHTNEFLSCSELVPQYAVVEHSAYAFIAIHSRIHIFYFEFLRVLYDLLVLPAHTFFCAGIYVSSCSLWLLNIQSTACS